MEHPYATEETAAKLKIHSENSSDFMTQLDTSAARIVAGTLRPITSEAISKAIANTRPWAKVLLPHFNYTRQ